MARTALSIATYNKIYGMLRSSFNGKGMSFTCNAFADGSSVVTVVIAGGNAVVNINSIITAVWDESNKNIIGYKVSDDNNTYTVKNLSQASGILRRMASEARIILNKVQ